MGNSIMKILIIFTITALLIACSTTQNFKQNSQNTENQANNTNGEAEPFVIRRAPLEYPRFAKNNRIEGVVVLQVEIFADGTVGTVEVKKSVTPDPCVLSEAAVKSVKKWKFSPAKYKGKPVACWTTFPVVFELKNIR